MKAATRLKYGPANEIEISIRDIPSPRPNELVVRVMATTVNRTDVAVLTGKPAPIRLFSGLLRPRLEVPGTDFAGVVHAVGAEVSSFKEGDRVFGFLDDGLGTQAQFMRMTADGNLGIIPESIGFECAAASLEGAHYAYNTLKRIKVKKGQKILVNGATGAIGSALVQFLVQENIDVTAVCGTENIEKVKSLGASKVFDYKTQDFTTSDDQYDHIFDAVGKSTFGKCRHLIKPGGVYISSELGPWCQNPILALTTLFGSKRVVFPIPTDIKKSIAYIQSALDVGAFKPMIDRSYGLKDIAEAYRYVSSGEKTGNVILLPWE